MKEKEQQQNKPNKTKKEKNKNKKDSSQIGEKKMNAKKKGIVLDETYLLLKR